MSSLFQILISGTPWQKLRFCHHLSHKFCLWSMLVSKTLFFWVEFSELIQLGIIEKWIKAQVFLLNFVRNLPQNVKNKFNVWQKNVFVTKSQNNRSFFYVYGEKMEININLKYLPFSISPYSAKNIVFVLKFEGQNGPILFFW